MEVKLHPAVILLSFLLLSAILYIFFKKPTEVTKIDKALLEKYSKLETDYSNLKNDNLTLENYIASIESENVELLAEISKYQLAGETVKYVDRIVYKTKEVQVEKPIDTVSYIYKGSSGLPLCYFENKSTSFSFKVLPVEYTVDLIKTDLSTSVKLKAKSSFDKKEYLLPVSTKETKTTTISSRKLIDPKLSLGASVNFQYPLEFHPVVSFPFLHITENTDLAVPKIQLSSNPTVGLDLVSYNIASKLPVVSDLWVGFGPSIGIAERNINITLVSRF